LTNFRQSYTAISPFPPAVSFKFHLSSFLSTLDFKRTADYLARARENTSFSFSLFVIEAREQSLRQHET